MVQDLYEALLDEIGKKLKIPDLKPNAQNTCMIEMHNGLQISLQFAAKSSEFLIGAKIAKLPPGRYRMDVLLEALKSNGLSDSLKQGTFGYNQALDELYLFKLIPTTDLTSDKILDHFHPLKEKANLWFEALKRGEIPSPNSNKVVTGGGMFGLR